MEMKKPMVVGIVAFGLLLIAAAAKASFHATMDDGTRGGQVVATDDGVRGGQFSE
jgi:hypothetical protein